MSKFYKTLLFVSTSQTTVDITLISRTDLKTGAEEGHKREEHLKKDLHLLNNK